MVFSRLHSVSSRPDHAANGDERPVTPGSHPIELSIIIESPPCVMYGSATESSGALLSGLLNLNIKDPYKKNKNNNSDGKNISSSGTNNLTSTISTPVSSTAGVVANGSNSKRKSGLFTSFSNLSMTTSNDPSNNILSTTSSNSNNNSLQGTPSNLKILSGYTKLPIVEVTLSLVQTIHYHKPFLPESSQIQSCGNCKKKVTNIKTWDIQSDTINKPVGTHSYPFSYLIPGSVPATCRLGDHGDTQVKYELIASATYIDPRASKISSSTSSTTTTTNTTNRPNKKDKKLLKLIMPVPVTRSIPRGPDKNSLRVFPPTELTAAAVLPNVVYPKSTFPLELKLDGVSSDDRRWRMRKLAWRIEETTKIRGHSCSTHKSNLSQLEKEVKRKELERSKKPAQAIKRYGDIGPQIKVTVASPDNLPMTPKNVTLPSSNNNSSNHNNNSNSSISNNNSSDNAGSNATNSPVRSSPMGPVRRRNAQGVQDTDDDDDTTNENDVHFVHPSDDALRQEILQQQRRAREEQLKKEIANNNSMLFTEEVRIISKGEIKSGWKTDFENNGKIELVTDIDCMSLNSGVGNPVLFSSTSHPYINPHKSLINVACDIQDPNLGIYVSHILAVEIVVAEETLQYANGQPINKSKSKSNMKSSSAESDADQRLAELSPMWANRNNQKARPISEEDHSSLKHSISNDGSNSKNANGQIMPKIVSVPTGAARVLRMQFRLNVTERSGLGISWDEEVPPIYQDVKHSAPPTYENTVAVLPSYTIQEGDETSFLSERTTTVPMNITPPPMAHHGSINTAVRTTNTLSAVQSPQLENVISIQGNVPFRNSVLTPSTTQDLGVRNISELLDTDRITQ